MTKAKVVVELPGEPTPYRLDLIREKLVAELEKSAPELGITKSGVTCHPMSSHFSLDLVEVRLRNFPPETSAEEVGSLSIDIGHCIRPLLTKRLRESSPKGIEVRLSDRIIRHDQEISFRWGWEEFGA